MDFAIELIFFFVFFVPMGILVTINLLLHMTLPDVCAPWERLTGPSEEPVPQAQQQAPVPVPAPAKQAEVSNDEEALEAA